MKKTTPLVRMLLGSLLTLFSLFTMAQNPTYELYVTNQQQNSSKIYQFDVYLLRTGSTALQMSSMQFGLGVDTSIINGGTLTFAMVSGSSQLNAAQVPTSDRFSVSPGLQTVNSVVYRYLNMSAMTPPGAGNGTTISATKESCSSPGTRIGTFTVTNTVDFKQASRPKHVFSTAAASGRANTLVSAYVGTTNTNITVTASNLSYTSTQTCDQNPSLNGCAVTATITSNTGVTCFGGSDGAVIISLSGAGSSSSGSYSVDGGSAVSYSSNPFTVGSLSAGSHSISITSGSCSASTGSFNISAPSSALTSSFNASACDSYALPWGGNATTTGAYTHVYTSAAGCDSTVTANITINSSSSNTSSATACDSYTWSVNGQTYTVSGSYTSTSTNASGCPHAEILNLTINSSTSQTSSVTACDNYTWVANGQTYTVSGSYTATSTNTAGCPHTRILDLTINSSTSNTTTATACDSYVWSVNGQTYTASGSYTVTSTNTAGCPHTEVLNLTINSSSSNTSSATACDSYTWSVNGQTYTVSGSYTSTSTNASGCPHAEILNLTINSSTSQTSSVTACDSYTWVANGQTYTVSGSYTATSTNTAGCPHTRILDLTINSSTSNTTTATACDSYVWSVNGQTYTASGSYTVTSTNTAGCPHTEVLNLTINSSSSNTSSATACDSYVWSVNGQTYTVSGSYTSTSTNASGCPHAEILNLTINSSTSQTSSVTACDSYTWVANGQTYTVSGSYTATSTNTAGCPHTRILDLTINSSTSNTTTATACDSYVWSVNGQTYTASGSYTVTSINTAGCPHTEVLNLTINESISSSSSAVACGSYTLPWGTTVTTGGSYSNVYQTVAGCDSTVTVNVTINVATSSTSDVSICASAAPYVWNGNSYSTSGSRTFTTTNAAGCDSTAVLNLTVNVATSFTQIVTACNSFSWNGQTYTTSGSRTFTTTNAAGCDSTAILNLTISGSIPATPGAITQTLVNNSCGARRYRFSVPFVSASITYSWSFNSSAVASTATIDSGGTGNVILATFTSNAIAATTDSVRVRAVNGCGSSANVRLKLTNTAWAPLAAPVITTTNLITNVCGGRKVRYSIPVPATTAGSVAIEWSFVGSVLGANAVIDSGTSSSTKIVVLYTSNLAAVANDSVRVRYNYNSGCSFGAFVRSKISLTSYLPATPAAPSITLVSNACGAKTYRYRSAASLPAATATTAAATGWFWSFTGTLGANAVIDSGDANSQTILVRFTSNAAAAASGDSVRVCYTSDCGNGANGKAKLTNVVTAPPAKPASLGITLVANNCGAKVYRYAAPALVAQTATTAAATGWLWSFTGTLGANAVIDSGDANSRTILVRFTSNAAAAASGDSVRVSYTSSCGNSANNVAKLTNVVTTVPVAPASPIITTIDANTCGARRYRYRAASATLPAATATATAATGWLWSFTGTLGANATIDSGNINSSVITVTFTSNAAAAASGDSVRLQYTSSCGNSGFGRTKLSNTLFATPTPATAPAITLVSDVCGARVYRYRAPALVSATATAPAATGWQWSFVGTLGLNAVVDSGSLTSQVVVMRFTSNAGSATGDSARVAYTSACGTGAFKSTKLSNVAKLGCPTPISKVSGPASFGVNVFPNPSQGQFNVQLSGATSEEVSVRVLDAQGRFIKSIRSAANGTITLGSDLRPGSYMLEVRQGRNVKVTRVLKF